MTLIEVNGEWLEQCDNCGNIWDGNAQCPCWQINHEEEEDEEDQEDDEDQEDEEDQEDDEDQEDEEDQEDDESGYESE